MWEVIVMTYKVIFIIKVQKTPYKLEIHYYFVLFCIQNLFILAENTEKKCWFPERLGMLCSFAKSHLSCLVKFTL